MPKRSKGMDDHHFCLHITHTHGKEGEIHKNISNGMKDTQKYVQKNERYRKKEKTHKKKAQTKEKHLHVQAMRQEERK